MDEQTLLVTRDYEKDSLIVLKVSLYVFSLSRCQWTVREKRERIVIELEWSGPISTMVKYLTHILKVEGSDPTAGTMKEKTAWYFMELKCY